MVRPCLKKKKKIEEKEKEWAPVFSSTCSISLQSVERGKSVKLSILDCNTSPLVPFEVTMVRTIC
jgi:hypothetical protein